MLLVSKHFVQCRLCSSIDAAFLVFSALAQWEEDDAEDKFECFLRVSRSLPILHPPLSACELCIYCIY